MFHGVYHGRVRARTKRGILVAIGQREPFIPVSDARLEEVRPGDVVRSTWRDDHLIAVTVTLQNGEQVPLELD